MNFQHQALAEEIKRAILPLLEANGCELVELTLVRRKNNPILRLLVDRKDSSIDLEEAARLNRQIGDLLDAREIMEDKYILEVSSPGLDRPLKEKNDFLRCINKEAVFFLNEYVNEKLQFEGLITKVTDDSVYIDLTGNMVELPLSKISKAKQIITDI